VAVPERTEGGRQLPRVGFVGAGQLARMCCEAASAIGVDTVVLATSRDDAAVTVASEVVLGSPTDPGALGELAARCDVVTFDHELVDLELLRALEATGRPVRPSSAALEAAVNKAFQRRRFAEAGLCVPEFVVLEADRDADLAALGALADRLGRVPVVKLARGGYDGRGVVIASDLDEAAAAVAAWRESGAVVVAEAPVDFRCELATLVVRRAGGESVVYRAVQTTQLDGVCREIQVPGGIDDETSIAAGALALRAAELTGAVGVMAVELFATADGLVVNEVALRPHNSGHWTIEGATTSQFENHLRAVLDLPLGATELTARAISTVNVFGGASGILDAAALTLAMREPTAKLHLYGKRSRPGRKLGHVTVLGDDADQVSKAAWRSAAALGTPVSATVGAGR
jgi:5-(carboxyamino)imidazole ribonucleotide synthase